MTRRICSRPRWRSRSSLKVIIRRLPFQLTLSLTANHNIPERKLPGNGCSRELAAWLPANDGYYRGTGRPGPENRSASDRVPAHRGGKMAVPPPCPQPQNFDILTGFLTPGSDTGPGVLDGSIAAA